MSRRNLAVLSGPALCFAAALALGGTADRQLAQATASHSPRPLPGDSLYQLPITLTTAGGTSLKLAELRGRPALITLFYRQCTSVCPLLTLQLQRLTQNLSRSEQLKLRVLLVSFDSARDTPESLSAFAQEHHIEGKNWIIARASVADVRALAVALGIQFRELPDHSFNHSTLISLADRDGVIQDKTADLSDVNGDFVAAIQKQIKSVSATP